MPTATCVCSYQDLVCSAMVEKQLDFNMFVAVVNNNLIGYDQARDLASCIDSAISANNDHGGGGGRDDKGVDADGGMGDKHALAPRGRVSLDSEEGVLTETAIHAEMEEACRCGCTLVSTSHGLPSFRLVPLLFTCLLDVASCVLSLITSLEHLMRAWPPQRLPECEQSRPRQGS
jgi:hypothetical protein